jgi:hypothetical protein
MKLTKAQRDQMVMVIVGTAAIGAALWYFVVNDRNQVLRQTQQKSQQMGDKLSKAEDLIRKSETISDTLRTQSNKLQQIEATLAPDRDAYSWVITNMNSFVTNWEAKPWDPSGAPPNLNTSLPHEVHISSYSQAEVSDKGLIPHFPYRWATFHVKGVAYFHDLGRFIADFENNFKYFRVQNLEMAPTSGVSAEPEKLAFNFDLVAPVQTTGQ